MPSAEPLRVYDGFGPTPLGVSGADHPLDAPDGGLFRLINGTVRSGRPAPRPGFQRRSPIFPTNRYADIFATGKFQGAYAFDGTSQNVVFAVSGHVFLLDVSTMAVRCLTDTAGRMDPLVDRMFFLWTGDFLLVQDGINRPIIFDGSSARRSSFEDQEVPVGTFMAFGYGRISVTIAGTSSFIVGDFSTPDDPSSCLKFTETEYLSDGGAFSLPMALGKITGMAFLRSASSATSLGLLVVSGENGISYFNVAYPRSAWSTIQISSVGVIGHGVATNASFVNIDDDLLYLSNEGDIRTSKASREDSTVLIHRSYSREISCWLRDNTLSLLPFGSAMLHNRRVLCTVAAEWTTSEVDGKTVADVRHKGIVALDYDRAGAVNGTDRPAFDGLWTGVRPVALVSCRSVNRGFVFSRDSDDKTRLYEIVEGALDEDSSLPVMQIQPPSISFAASDGSKLLTANKTFRALEVWLEHVRESTRVSYAIAADAGPWSFGDPIELSPVELSTTAPQNGRLGSWPAVILPTPPKSPCHPGNSSNPLNGYRFDLRIFVEGGAEIVTTRASGDYVVHEPPARPVGCAPVISVFDMKPIDDYGYNILTARRA